MKLKIKDSIPYWRAAFIFNCTSCFYFLCHSDFLWFSFNPFMVIKSFSLLQVYKYITSISIFYFLFFITSCESYQFLFSTYKLCWSPFTTALQKLIETCWHTKIQASLVKNTTSCKNSTATPNPKYINKYTTRW